MFYTDIQSIEEKKRNALLVENYEDVKIYQDKSGYKWRYAILWSAMLERKIELIETYPVINISDLIKRIPTINDPETIAAIAIVIAQRKFDDDVNNRLLLIRILEEALVSNPEKVDKIKLCIYESELFDATNRAEIIGKSPADIAQDAAIYQSIAQRAKAILDKSNTTNVKN